MVSTAAAPRISAPMVGALEAMWSAIVTRHPEVPAAVIVVASGTDGRKTGQARWGQFAASRWVRGDTQLPEVLVAGEGLARGADAVLATLLHESGHGLAHARAINDTSRQGRYHNRRYQALAEELGLEVATVANFGWASTTLSVATRDEYRRELVRLSAALTLFRRAERAPGASKAKSTNLLVATCGCPRKIRVASATLAAGPIECGLCGHDFAAAET